MCSYKKKHTNDKTRVFSIQQIEKNFVKICESTKLKKRNKKT